MRKAANPKYEIDAHGLRWPGDKRGEFRTVDPDEVEACKRYLARCERTRKPVIGSYALKHWAENWAGRYISNGACITAALELGFVVDPAFAYYSVLCEGKVHDATPLNCFIGVSRRSLRHPK